MWDPQGLSPARDVVLVTGSRQGSGEGVADALGAGDSREGMVAHGGRPPCSPFPASTAGTLPGGLMRSSGLGRKVAFRGEED